MSESVARRLYRDSYTIVGYLLFLITIIDAWRGYVRKHEAIYLLGSRRIVDPEFLAGDLSWATVPPTSFLFDHMVAPLWAFFSDFDIVTIGRVVSWFLLAWSLSMLARTLRLPASARADRRPCVAKRRPRPRSHPAGSSSGTP